MQDGQMLGSEVVAFLGECYVNAVAHLLREPVLVRAQVRRTTLSLTGAPADTQALFSLGVELR